MKDLTIVFILKIEIIRLYIQDVKLVTQDLVLYIYFLKMEDLPLCFFLFFF